LTNYFNAKNAEEEIKTHVYTLLNDFYLNIKWDFSNAIRFNIPKYELENAIYPVILRDLTIFPELQTIYYKFECVVLNPQTNHYDAICTFKVNSNLINLFNINKHLFHIICNWLAIEYNNCDLNCYHTIFHVDNMLTKLTELTDLSDYDYRMLYLTICFHDAEYTPGKDNETIAINTVKNILLNNKLIKTNEYKSISKLIDTTRIGTSISNIIKVPLADILHDLDYFSFTDKNFAINTDKIYFENKALVNLDTFKFNRSTFLTNLLDNTNHKIFVSKYFQMYNQLAVKNINNELEDTFKYVVKRTGDVREQFKLYKK
jgi:predicted metal-dependent HD superfamily phosphohydrolase